MEEIIIYTDGSCYPNPGHGGYAAILIYKNNIKKLSFSQRNSTNNKMELSACIIGLNELESPSKVKMYTDSKYVINGITKWIKKWRSRNWKTAEGKDVKNKCLWIILDNLCCKHDVTFEWVKGHSGDKYNDMCDELANKARLRINKLEV